MKRLRVGIIGLGDEWQNRHAPALHALAERFEVRAICDQVTHRAEMACEQFPGAKAVDGYHELTAREDIEAILILSPQWYGALPILTACNAGKSVYCGAGLELQLDDVRQIRECAEKSGVKFVAEFPPRHTPAVLRLKELIATQLGNPRLLFCHLRLAKDVPAAEQPQGKSVRDLTGLVDLCCYIVGTPPSSVTGLMHSAASMPKDGGEDYQMMSLDFSPLEEPGSKAVAQISFGRYMPSAWQEAITYRPLAMLQVVCENGVAFIDLPATLVWFDESGRHQEALESERPVGEQLLSNFHWATLCPSNTTADLDEAFRALTIVQHARASHREGRRIEV